MIRDAHKAQEAMHEAALAMKNEQWGEAERSLQEVQGLVAQLLREVGDKTQEALRAPKPDERDRE